MATTNDAKKALAKKAEPTLVQLVEAMRPEIAKALPRHMTGERMARVATTLLRQTPRLRDVVPASFLGAIMTCAQLGLEPGPLGLAWIIPREVRDKGRPTGVWEAHFQLGYKGAIELARRSGQLAKITARTVYSNEDSGGRFVVEYVGAEERIDHRPILIGDRGIPVLYYAIAKLASGEENWAPLTPDQVETRHRRRSTAPNSPAWTNDYEAMAWKSCVIELRRWLPQSPELESALAWDGRVRTDTAPEALEQAAPDIDLIDGTVEEPGEPAEAEAWPEPARPPDAVDGEAT